MKVIGVFKEIEDTEAELESIHNFANKLSKPERDLIVRYLNESVHVMTYMGVSFDPFAVGLKAISGGYSICSDGEWIWRLDLLYFVENHRIGLPREFIDHVSHLDGIWRADEMSIGRCYEEIMEDYRRLLKSGSIVYR